MAYSPFYVLSGSQILSSKDSVFSFRNTSLLQRCLACLPACLLACGDVSLINGIDTWGGVCGAPLNRAGVRTALGSEHKGQRCGRVRQGRLPNIPPTANGLH